jgi:hypothetical protein
MGKKVVKVEPKVEKTKRTKKVVEQVVEAREKPTGMLIKEEPNGDKHYAGQYSYTVYNAVGEKISFDIDWNLLSLHMKELGKVG